VRTLENKIPKNLQILRQTQKHKGTISYFKNTTKKGGGGRNYKCAHNQGAKKREHHFSKNNFNNTMVSQKKKTGGYVDLSKGTHREGSWGEPVGWKKKKKENEWGSG